jgi:hypothetical protein
MENAPIDLSTMPALPTNRHQTATGSARKKFPKNFIDVPVTVFQNFPITGLATNQC